MFIIDSSESEQHYYLVRNPSGLPIILGKLYVFAFTWSFGACFARQDDMDDDAGIGRKGGDRQEFVEIDIASEFDTFTHELFELEPPLGQYITSYIFGQCLFSINQPVI